MDHKPRRLVQRIGQAILARRSVAANLGWTLALVIVPTVVRLALDAGRNGVPFVSYFPAVVLGALFLGWRYGLLVTFVSATVARVLFIREGLFFVESARGLIILALFVLSCAMLIAIGEALRRVLAEVHAASAREALLNQELRHRLKN